MLSTQSYFFINCPTLFIGLNVKLTCLYLLMAYFSNLLKPLLSQTCKSKAVHLQK